MEKKDNTAKNRNIFGMAIKLFINSVFSLDLISLNKGLIKCREIDKDPYYKRQVWWNRIIMVTRFAPSALAVLVVFMMFEEPVVKNYVDVSISSLKHLYRAKSFSNFTPPGEELIVYIKYSLSLICVLFSCSFFSYFITRQLNPLIVETKKLKEELLDSGYSNKDHIKFICSCPAGMLVTINTLPKNIIKDESFWGRINRVPGDVLEDPKNSDVFLIKNGFILKNRYVYEY